MPLFMNCVERNPTIHFLMLGDEPPTDGTVKKPFSSNPPVLAVARRARAVGGVDILHYYLE